MPLKWVAPTSNGNKNEARPLPMWSLEHFKGDDPINDSNFPFSISLLPRFEF